MQGVRRAGQAVVLIALCCVAASCGSSSRTTSTAPEQVSIVALGDSVPHGTNCDCTPYPELTAGGLTTSARKVTAANEAVAGSTTADVLHQLSDPGVIDRVRTARVVEIEVGANDVAYSSTCGTSVDCYAPAVPAIEKNLAAIVARVHELSAGPAPLVVLLDYWSVWLGGRYATAHGEAYVAAAEEMTHRVDAAIESVAGMTGSAYVDLRAAFKGPDYAYDETHYLSSDGDHPNAAGHEKIAAATEAVIEQALHL